MRAYIISTRTSLTLAPHMCYYRMDLGMLNLQSPHESRVLGNLILEIGTFEIPTVSNHSPQNTEEDWYPKNVKSAKCEPGFLVQSLQLRKCNPHDENSAEGLKTRQHVPSPWRQLKSNPVG